MNMSHIIKRAIDIVGAACGLVVFAAPILATAAVVRWRLGAPVLFRQQRPGKDERLFTLFKFRTMTDRRDARGELLPDAERLTPLGRLIRRWSLDELPQLWNVLRGDMSFVGPRPLLVEYLPRYDATQRRRHRVRPGITGWAQVNGRNAISWSRRFELDVWYVDHWSLWLDLRILLLTVRGVLSGHGVSEEGQATRAPFLGNEAGADTDVAPTEHRAA